MDEMNHTPRFARAQLLRWAQTSIEKAAAALVAADATPSIANKVIHQQEAIGALIDAVVALKALIADDSEGGAS